MIKKLALSLILCLLIFQTPTFANETKHPSEFWQLIEKEQAAIAVGNASESISVKLAIIALYDTWTPTNQMRLEVVTPRYEHIAKIYESLKDYETAIVYWKLYISEANRLIALGVWNDDSIKFAQSKIKNLTFNVDLYIKVDDLATSTYYGAKFEPTAGVYFGSAYDLDPQIKSYNWDQVRKVYPKKNAAYLIYLDWNEPIAQFDRYFQAAVQAGNGIQLAWNTYDVLENIQQYDSHINEVANYLNNLKVPIFLRYACEMNVGENGENPAVYVKNFRYVTERIRFIAPNVAMVWSPNDITDNERSLDSYYPGDAYVDWVGISSYTSYYFGDKTDWGSLQESIDTNFFTGPNANPLAKIAEIIDKYGNRKPIMLSEVGIAHYSKVAKEDMTDWALIQMDRLYYYGPMVYPQLKGIYYFNVDSETATIRSTYALYLNDAIKNKYNALVANDYYLSNVNQSATYRYAKVGAIKDKTISTSKDLDLMTYTIVPNELKPKITYELNGQVLATMTAIPYNHTITNTSVSEGEHTLKVIIKDSQGNTLKTSVYTLSKTQGRLKIEKGTFNVISFSDMASHWSIATVNEVAKRGIIVGSAGRFNPDANITRAEASSIISKLIGTDKTGVISKTYSDVQNDQWYAPMIQKAQAYLIGYGNQFFPLRQATREEIIAAIVNLKGYNIKALNAEEITALKARIIDFNDVSASFKDHILLAVHFGVIGGYPDGSVKPLNPIKRSEVTVILYNSLYK
jgi:hypothetical protein